MFIFKKQIHYLGHLVSGTSILLLTDRINALMKLKLPTNIKEVRHFWVSQAITENSYTIVQILHTP